MVFDLIFQLHKENKKSIILLCLGVLEATEGRLSYEGYLPFMSYIMSNQV